MNSTSIVRATEKDIDVPPWITEKLYNKANQPKELIRIADLDHHYDRIPEMINVVNQFVKNFFITNLQ